MIQGAAFRVLACFYRQDTCNFADICAKAGYPTDLGGYYLRQLVSGGSLRKIDRGSYTVTPQGKQQLAFYYGKQLSVPWPRLMVLLVPRQGDQYIVLKRKAQPFMNTYEWPAGAVRMGEDMETAVKRVALERLEQTGDIQFKGFFRRTDLYEDITFDDKIFAIYTCQFPQTAAVAASNHIGDNVWHDPAELNKLDKPSKALTDIVAFTQHDEPFVQCTYTLTLDDL